MNTSINSSKYAALLYADSEREADQLYLGKIQVPDAFISFQFKGKSYAVVSVLEYTRVQKESAFDVVLPMDEITDLVVTKFGLKSPRSATVAQQIQVLAEKYEIPGFVIGHNFPAGVALDLAKAGVDLEVSEGMLFPEREFKKQDEQNAIQLANKACAHAFSAVEDVLKASTVVDGIIHYNGEALTSEYLHQVIAIACLEKGAMASGTIAAGGDQACDPHCVGYGPIPANQLIVVDIFPRRGKDGYHGDMTRTYIKGKPNPEQRKLVETVFEAQKMALEAHKPGADGSSVYMMVKNFFTEQGYPTENRDGVNVGFFHGLGHGLGLEVHEPPRVNPSDMTMKVGEVITVEPGLYYPGVGGCRWEDVVVITEEGNKLLSDHGYNWIIE